MQKILSQLIVTRLNSGAIDEFLVIFLAALKQKVFYFSKLGELNQKESPRLEWAENFKKFRCENNYNK